MYKLRRDRAPDLFTYHGEEVFCTCGLRATRSISHCLERYFGCPLEKEDNCGFYLKLEIHTAVEKTKRENDYIIREKDAIIHEKDAIIYENQEEIATLRAQIDTANLRIENLAGACKEWMKLLGTLEYNKDN
ncbi:hypothetical protein LINPERHAP1_LOCUS6436 [Linum perenne]